jgi:hypothetical protein
VLGELPQRLHQPLRAGLHLAGVGDLAGVVEVDHLAVVFFQPRLVVVRIDVADAALHEQENHSLGSRREVRLLGGQWIRGDGRLLGQTGQGHVAETASRRLQRLSASDQRRGRQ